MPVSNKYDHGQSMRTKGADRTSLGNVNQINTKQAEWDVSDCLRDKDSSGLFCPSTNSTNTITNLGIDSSTNSTNTITNSSPNTDTTNTIANLEMCPSTNTVITNTLTNTVTTNTITNTPTNPSTNTHTPNTISRTLTLGDRLFRLQDTRVLQRNLVYIIGIPRKYSCPSVLSSDEFFGRFGAIRKIVVKNYETRGERNLDKHSAHEGISSGNNIISSGNIISESNKISNPNIISNTTIISNSIISTNTFGTPRTTPCTAPDTQPCPDSNTSHNMNDPNDGLSQAISYTNSTISCYITYYSVHSAIRCISCLDESLFDNRPIRVTFGTTKYCSFFLKNKQCTNEECMYLHTVEDNEIVQAKGKFKLHTFKPENKGINVLGKERIDLTQLFRYKDIGGCL